MGVTPSKVNKDSLLVAEVLSVGAAWLSVLCRDWEVPSRSRTPAESQSGMKEPPPLRDDSVRMPTVQPECSV